MKLVIINSSIIQQPQYTLNLKIKNNNNKFTYVYAKYIIKINALSLF